MILVIHYLFFTGNQIQSNLPLQMALYFNVGIFPLWFVVIIVNLDAKVNTIKYKIFFKISNKNNNINSYYFLFYSIIT